MTPDRTFASWGTNGQRPAGSNAPLLLTDPTVVWKVVGGRMHVFAAEIDDDKISGPREFLFQVEPGDVLFGGSLNADESVALIAVGGTDAMVVPRTLVDVQAFASAQPDVGAAVVERFVSNMSTALAVRNAPRIDVIVSDDQAMDLRPGTRLSARRDVTWLTVSRGAIWLAGEMALALSAHEGALPLASGAWVEAESDLDLGATVQPIPVAALLEDGRVWPALAEFQRMIVSWSALRIAREQSARITQMRSRVDADEGARRDALTAMATVMASRRARADRKKGVPLLAAMEMVGTSMGISFRAPGTDMLASDPYSAARSIAQASSVGQRRVKLSTGWWNREAGPLLGFLELRLMLAEASAEGHDDVELVPVALLPMAAGGYEMVNPETGSRSVVSDALDTHIAAFGVQFYRGLPSATVRAKDLWRFASFSVRADARLILGVGIAGACVGLLLPLLTAYLFDDVIPSADQPALGVVFAALCVAALSATAFEVTRSIAVLRVHTRLETAMQMAVLDRLVRLPTGFFRKYSAGDLGRRAMGINTIGLHLGSATISAILSCVVSAGSFVLLFRYSVPLALLTTATLAVDILVSLFVARYMLHYTREHQEAAGKLAGLVLQLLDGIAKLRVSATEGRAFARWSIAFRRQEEVAFKIRLFSTNIEAFQAALGILSMLAMYGVYARMAQSAGGGLSTGSFLAFSAASGTFLASGMALSALAISLVDLIPTWERSRPLLETVPETDFFKPDPGVLTGHIEVNHINFAYAVDSPQILFDVSLEVRPGEFIALVGPSGSGKSTLLRILLGFEKQRSGAVRFDGHDVSTVDVTAVRRQIGVVLQNSTLTAGSIFDNIVGAALLTMEDAWEAARMAGMEDDMHAMPMGMHTVIQEGGGSLSGGQRQRLLIARALVGRPRILFFDEATSALDNRTQRMVSESVDAMHATRVVVAHRLSTIRNADRIYVMEGGRVTETGTYHELMALGGLFASMAIRQEA